MKGLDLLEKEIVTGWTTKSNSNRLFSLFYLQIKYPISIGLLYKIQFGTVILSA
jgi:hypothetical protein